MNSNQVWNAQSRSVSDGALVVKDAEFNEICVIREKRDRIHGEQDQADIRNAMLIAAAPELLAMLKKFAFIDTTTHSDLWAIEVTLCKQARDLIAKVQS